MNDIIAKLSNERLEQEIAGIYYSYYRDGVPVPANTPVLDMLWVEFDARFAAKKIDRNPETGHLEDEL